jgi:diacylglycerol kinase (ATP)
MGGGLAELRTLLTDAGVTEPIWHEISRSREAPDAARRAIAEGATLLFVWGGDGTLQRCFDVVAGEPVTLAILPAGTANLLAANLGIANDLATAVRVGLDGDRRVLDVGVLDGKRFGVMAGVGFDARIMQIADGELKDRYGQLAYVWAAVRSTRMPSRTVHVEVDGVTWFKGRASGVLLGQMGVLTGGLVAFPDARPDDGELEVGVVTAERTVQWLRVLARLLSGHPERSPFVETTRGRTVDIDLDRPTAYELDGGARKPKSTLHAHVDPGAITVCVPNAATTEPRPDRGWRRRFRRRPAG